MKNTKCVIWRAAAVVAAVMLSSAQANLELRVPPVVGAEASTVFIDDESERFKYYAPVFLGEKMQWMDVLYDTMSDWTVITDEYDPDQSATATPWLDEDYNVYNDVVVGTQLYSGPIFNETMCLIRGEAGGQNRLCVKNSPIVLTPFGDDLGGYQGVLGLSHGEMNYVRLLEQERVLLDNVVTLDYDTHVQERSSVGFGTFNASKANDGKLFVLPNAGHTKWTLKVTEAFIGDRQIDSENDVAFIDSGNTTIQLPKDVYDQVYDEIKKLQQGHLRFREQYEFGQAVKLIKVNAECDDIVDDLPTLKLNIAPGVTIEIDPRAYVFPPREDDYYCRISLAASNEGVYRLGTQFLKSFYTVLDFDGKQIMLGSKSKHALITGDESLLYKEPQPEPIPEPVPEKPEDGADSKDDDTNTGTPDSDDSEEQPKDDKEEQQPEGGDDDQKGDDSQEDDSTKQDESSDDTQGHQEEKDTTTDEKDADDDKTHKEEEKHEDEKPDGTDEDKPSNHEEKKPEQHETPAPPKPAQKKKAPAKPKSWVDVHIVDPIMDPILAMLHFIQHEIDAITNMIMAPFKMLSALKF